MRERLDDRSLCLDLKPVVALARRSRDLASASSMANHRLPSALILVVALCCTILFPALCRAQENSDTEAAAPKGDAEGCADLAAFARLATSTIVSCNTGDSVQVTMPLKPDAQGYARQKLVRGAYEYREYQISQADQQEQAFDNLMQLLPIAGFTVKYSMSPSTITARKDNVWVLVNISGEFYNVSFVATKEDAWTPVTDVEGISREMQARSRVAIYGVEFSPDNQAVTEHKPQILDEVVNYLKANPRLAVAIESHKMSPIGSAEVDQEITRKRAQAVVAWLEAHGIAAARLQPKALGRSKPITENDTPLEIQQNERIELAKPTS
jgi:outer membrane protein OmpA-like peptidoglycan-associated protein